MKQQVQWWQLVIILLLILFLLIRKHLMVKVEAHMQN